MATESRPHIPSWIKKEVLRNHGWVCHLCGMDIARASSIQEGRGLSFDHVVPYSHGGGDTVENLRPAHLVCNRRRGTHQLDRYRSGVIAPNLTISEFRRVIADEMVVRHGQNFYKPVVRGYTDKGFRRVAYGRFIEIAGIATSVTVGIFVAGLIAYFLTPLFYFGLIVIFFATRPKKNRYGNRGKRKWRRAKKKSPIPSFKGRRQYLVRCLVRWEEVSDPPSKFISTYRE